MDELGKLAYVLEGLAVQMGQTLDVIGLRYTHYLSQRERDDIAKWSEVMDTIRSHARDLMTDHIETVPAKTD